MAKKPEAPAVKTADGSPKPWRPSTRFVEYKGRKMGIKLVDDENGFKAGQVAMTVNGPAPISHATMINIDKDGYVPRTEAEERALMRLATLPIGVGKGASHLVTWENREMPLEQRKAELSAAEYKKRIEELEDQVASKSDLENENAAQTRLIEDLKKQLAAQGA